MHKSYLFLIKLTPLYDTFLYFKNIFLLFTGEYCENKSQSSEHKLYLNNLDIKFDNIKDKYS